jgi:acetyl-CoA synthetase
MIPEAAIAMLACARLGAPHSVVFGGFSADALKSRIATPEAKVVITADGGYRRGGLRAQARRRRRPRGHAPTVENVLVIKRTGQDTPGPRAATCGGTT